MNSHRISFVAKLSHRTARINAFYSGVPLFNASVWSNLCEYRYESYIVKKWILWAFYRRLRWSNFNCYDVYGYWYSILLNLVK